MKTKTPFGAILLFAASLAAFGCGGDETEADRLGVGAQCEADEECDEETNQFCLDQFKGGYCGIEGCQEDADCPEASACVTHDDGNNYCFRLCADKPECNVNRDLDNESNCSGSAEFVEGAQGRKACIPPSA